MISLTVASHPLARSIAQAYPSKLTPAVELQIVICTTHGPVVIDEPAGTPPAGKDNPSCPWCAVAGGSAAKSPFALTTTPVAQLERPRRAGERVAACRAKLASAAIDWAAHAPRGLPAPLAKSRL